MRCRFAALFCLALLAACAPRGTVTLDPAAAGVGAPVDVFYGTTRAYDPATGSFGAARSSRLSFGRLDISVPPDRRPGEITWPRPGARPDPAHDFVTLDSQRYASDSAFRRALSTAIRQAPAGRGEVTVYVHGFNNTFAESTYRLAQLTYDLHSPAVQIAYAWPSAGKAIRYAYDRDSVLFARDGLEAMLGQIVAAGASRILIVSHSLGAELTMEVLRDMALDRNHRVMSRISGVVLISPDLDTQVFRRQAKAIGKLPQPFVIVASSRDKALALSAALTGRSERLGNLDDLEKVSDLHVTVIDVSAYSAGPGGHFTVGDSPALLNLLGRIGDVSTALKEDRSNRRGLLPGFAQQVENATEIVLAPLGPAATSQPQ